MMRVKSDDGEIAYTTIGTGPDVVLLHAFPSSHEMWLPVANQIAQRYRVTLIDLRGHGDSSPGEGPATMRKHAGDVARVCREAGINRAVFGGVSIGGYILFEYWRRHPEQIRALILANTKASADTAEAQANRLKSAEEVLRCGPDQFLDSMLLKLLGESTRRNRPDVVAAARKTMRGSAAGIAAVQKGMAERPNSMSTLKTITVPTLIIAGEEDTLIPRSEAEAMHQGIANSDLRVIPGTGHYSVFERPEEAGKMIHAFLDMLG
jgi:3-oxoadipate enol-lactonase